MYRGWSWNPGPLTELSALNHRAIPPAPTGPTLQQAWTHATVVFPVYVWCVKNTVGTKPPPMTVHRESEQALVIESVRAKLWGCTMTREGTKEPSG